MTAAKLIELLAAHIVAEGQDVDVELWHAAASLPKRKVVTHCWLDAAAHRICIAAKSDQ